MAIKTNQDLLTKAQVALGLRMGRAALGWSQDEFAMRLDWAKTTLGRAETMDGGLRTEQFVQAIALLGSFGVTVQFGQDGTVSVSIGANGVQGVITRLTDEQFRRSDRRKPLGVLGALSPNQTTEVDSPLGRLATKKTLGGLSALSPPQPKEIDSPLGRLAANKKPPQSL